MLLRVTAYLLLVLVATRLLIGATLCCTAFDPKFPLPCNSPAHLYGGMKAEGFNVSSANADLIAEMGGCTSSLLRFIENGYLFKARPIGGGCNPDIAEHLPVLRMLLMEPHVTHGSEVGVRDGFATWAFLDAARERLEKGMRPLKIRLYDISKTKKVKALLQKVNSECPALDVELSEGNDLVIPIEETDIMLLDTWHSFRQLNAELKRIPHKIRRTLLLHDTVTFEQRDEGTTGHGGKPINEELFEGSMQYQGLLPAIKKFLRAEQARGETSKPNDRDSLFVLRETRTNCNGLTILDRQKFLHQINNITDPA
ncbi:hypothetical protein T484DRAFT_3632256 [Baffinella frigidus]|nr:hypothetical protein T484DRAFT_3632256 [Cryptophyta sp. CCMP2293]